MTRFAMAVAILVLSNASGASVLEGVRPTVMLGSAVLFERGNDNVSESSRLPLSLAAGARWQAWSTRLEYASFRATDGGDMVSVSRSVETAVLWGSYEFFAEERWALYSALGLGGLRTTAESRVLSAYETTEGEWLSMAAVAVGLRGSWAQNLAVRPELRYESAGGLKTKDARMGVFVGLELVF